MHCLFLFSLTLYALDFINEYLLKIKQICYQCILNNVISVYIFFEEFATFSYVCKWFTERTATVVSTLKCHWSNIKNKQKANILVCNSVYQQWAEYEIFMNPKFLFILCSLPLGKEHLPVYK